MITRMVLESMFTKMVIIMRECGKMTFTMEPGKSVTLMVLFMKEHGSKMKKMEKEFLRMKILRNLSKFGKKEQKFQKRLLHEFLFLYESSLNFDLFYENYKIFSFCSEKQKIKLFFLCF